MAKPSALVEPVQRFEPIVSWQRLGLLAIILTGVLACYIPKLLTTNLAPYRSASVGLANQLIALNKEAPLNAKNTARTIKPEDFPFNPNTVTEAELLRLGLSPKRAAAWLKYRGNRPDAFPNPASINKLRVLSPELKARLIKLAYVPAAPNNEARPPVESFGFEPNSVTPEQLGRLGLKPHQIKGWLSYRSKVPGGFQRINQIKSLRFLSPSEQERLAGLATFPPPAPLALKNSFIFDPNLISEDSLVLLGFPGWQAKGLIRYRGGRRVTFRKPADLWRVKSLDSGLVRLVLPLVEIGPFPPNSLPAAAPNFVTTPPPALASLDVNTADTTSLKSLPGIGSYRAKRILRYREALGGFYDLEQVGHTRGLPDSTFQLILPYLRVGPVNRKIAINKAAVADLKKHPYINQKLAAAVVRYREKHGPFTGPEDLAQIRSLRPAKLATLLPYLSYE